MDINVGAFYKNKTWYYLIPCLKGHGEKLRVKLSSIFKFACGIHDEYLEGSSVTEGKLLYILTDKKYRSSVWSDFMNWIKYEPYYVTDYAYRGDLGSRKHMLVLRVPEKYEKAYDLFLEGRYSEMYTQDQLDFIFDEPKYKKTASYKVLTKNPLAGSRFVDILKQEFDTDSLPDNIKEYDLPLKRKQEIFNEGAAEIVRPRFITGKQDIL